MKNQNYYYNSDTEKWKYTNINHFKSYGFDFQSVNKKIHTDSLLLSEFPNNWTNWYKRKLFSEHLVIIKGDDYKVTASPIIHFSKGKESENETNTFANTRGFVIEGDIGKSVSFYSTFSTLLFFFPPSI